MYGVTIDRFGFVDGFTKLLLNASTHNYNIHENSLWHTLRILNQMCLLQSSDNSFQRLTLPFLWVSKESPAELQQLSTNSLTPPLQFNSVVSFNRRHLTLILPRGTTPQKTALTHRTQNSQSCC